MKRGLVLLMMMMVCGAFWVSRKTSSVPGQVGSPGQLTIASEANLPTAPETEPASMPLADGGTGEAISADKTQAYFEALQKEHEASLKQTAAEFRSDETLLSAQGSYPVQTQLFEDVADPSEEAAKAAQIMEEMEEI